MTPKNDSDREIYLAKAKTLSEALPYMRRYSGCDFVIKYGGHAMGDDTLSREFARDVVLLQQVGIHPIVVHGGGPQIGAMLERLKIKSSFVDGLRVTDKATVEIVEMVLSGSINKDIVRAIFEAGGSAIGLSGKDGGMIEARKITRSVRDEDSNIEKVLDLGFVGEPVLVRRHMLNLLETGGDHSGHCTARHRGRRRDLQYQRRYRGRRGCRRTRSDAPPPADRCRRRPR